MTKLLIKDGSIVSMDDKIGNLEKGDILVVDGKIAEVGASVEASDAEVFDASHMIVSPGFVDTHRHVWQTQLRTIATDWSLFDYFCRMRVVYGGVTPRKTLIWATISALLKR